MVVCTDVHVRVVVVWEEAEKPSLVDGDLTRWYPVSKTDQIYLETSVSPSRHSDMDLTIYTRMLALNNTVLAVDVVYLSVV